MVNWTVETVAHSAELVITEKVLADKSIGIGIGNIFEQ